MNKVGMLLIIILILADGILISSLRKFLNDFLIGARNRKSAAKIHNQQSLNNRIFLNYIGTYLKNYKTAFRIYHGMYLAELISIVPQYVILIIINVLLADPNNIVIYSFIAVKLLFCLFMRLQVDSLMRSKYRNGK